MANSFPIKVAELFKEYKSQPVKIVHFRQGRQYAVHKPHVILPVWFCRPIRESTAPLKFSGDQMCCLKKKKNTCGHHNSKFSSGRSAALMGLEVPMLPLNPENYP